ncbi:hypothetical protein GC173_00870 [bacterium]|nr:hypothetical protein [bacterium]
MKTSRFLASMITAALGFAAGSATAATTSQVIDDLVVDFASGDYTTSTLTQDGYIIPPIERLRLATIDTEIAWDVVEKGDTRYVATGHEGKVFSQKGNEEAKLLTSFSEPELYTLADSAKHGLVVAASPGGNLYKIDDKGTTTSLAKLGAEMIWDLEPQGDDLLVATGTPATVSVVDARGVGSVRAKFEKPQNVLDIAPVPGSKDVVVATQGPGLVARVSPEGSVSVLVDPQQEEVRRVAVGPDGSIYAAINGVRSPGEKFLGVGAKPAPGGGGNNKPRPESFIIRIHPDGFAEEWWTSPESPIHDLSVRPDGSLLVAAGMKGAVMGVTPNRDTLRHGVADESIVTRLAPAKDGGVLALTGAEASIWRINPEKSASGEFVSKVYDAAGSARWVRARLLAEAGKGGVRIAFREGNTQEPDDTWSEWAGPSDALADSIQIPGGYARFFQYKLFLDAATKEAQPRVDKVTVYYTSPNVAPRLNEVKVEAQKPKEPAQAAAARGKYDVTWNAVDPNGDSLVANVYLKPLASGARSLIAEDVADGRLPVDSLSLPDGRYRFDVVVTDAPSNPLGTEASVEFSSPVVLFDNNPPAMTLQSSTRKGDTVTIRFTALDSASVIAGAEWRTGTKYPRPLASDDGALDSPSESFTLTLSGEDAKPGTLLIISIGDENGNRSFRDIIVE